MYDYDLEVIGSGPGGQKAAIAGAKLGKSVAVVERGSMLGEVCANSGSDHSVSAVVGASQQANRKGGY